VLYSVLYLLFYFFLSFLHIYSLFNNAYYNLSSKSKLLWSYPVKPPFIIQGIITVYIRCYYLSFLNGGVGSIDVTIASIIFFKIFRILFLWIILVIIDFWLQLRLVVGVLLVFIVRRVWRYQRGNQNPYIEEQTIQWSREKGQKDKQRSTKHNT